MATATQTPAPPGPKKRPTSKKFANRKVLRSQRLDLNGKGSHKLSEVEEAAVQMRATGMADLIEVHLGRRRDAVDRLSVLTLMVGIQLAAGRVGHRAQIVEIVRAINQIPAHVMAQLGSPAWTERGSYDRVHRLYSRFTAALDEGWTHRPDDGSPAIQVNLELYLRKILMADIPLEEIQGAAIAIDGTAMETSARFHSRSKLIALDGDYSKTDQNAVDYDESEKEAPARKKAAVLGVGEDGRNIYTRDAQARAGYRTATAKRKGGPFIGRELHLAVSVASIKHTNGVDVIGFNDCYPNLVVDMALKPAGAHRGKSVIPMLIEAHQKGYCAEVIADAGYSLQAEHFLLPLRKEGIGYTFRPASHQLGVKAFGALCLIDGQLFAGYTPKNLRNLKPPGYTTTGQQREELTKKYDSRAAYRYATHGNNNDGAWRVVSPLASGKIRSRSHPKTMRDHPNAPLVKLAQSTTDTPTLVIGVDEALTHQRIVPFTTAHNRAYGRRQLAETANSRIKGGPSSLTNIETGYTLLRDTARITVFLAHTLSNLNQIEYRNFRRNRQADGEHSKRGPRKNRARRTSDLHAKPAGPNPDP